MSNWVGNALLLRLLGRPIPSDEWLLAKDASQQNVSARLGFQPVVDVVPSEAFVDPVREVGGLVARPMPGTVVADLGIFGEFLNYIIFWFFF